MFTVEEIAEATGLQPRTIMRFLREKRIEGLTFGRNWKVVDSEMDLVLSGKKSLVLEDCIMRNLRAMETRAGALTGSHFNTIMSNYSESKLTRKQLMGFYKKYKNAGL